MRNFWKCRLCATRDHVAQKPHQRFIALMGVHRIQKERASNTSQIASNLSLSLDRQQNLVRRRSAGAPLENEVGGSDLTLTVCHRQKYSPHTYEVWTHGVSFQYFDYYLK